MVLCDAPEVGVQLLILIKPGKNIPGSQSASARVPSNT